MFEALAPYMSFPMKFIFSNLNVFSGLLVKIIPGMNASAGEMLGTGCTFRKINTDKDGNCTAEAFLRCINDEDLNKDINTLRDIASKYDIEINVKENEYYKKTPATFIMSGRGAVFSNYSCAASNILFNNVRLRNPINVVDEIEYLYKRYGIKEFVDVTVSFPMGEWLSLFCQTMIERKLNTTNFKVMPDNSVQLFDYIDDKELVGKTLFENEVAVTNLSNEGGTLEDYFVSMVGGIDNV